MQMNLSKHETANGWRSAMHEKGYSVPITLCQTIEKIMKKEKTSFPEAYKKIEDRKLISVRDKEILFNSSSDNNSF